MRSIPTIVKHVDREGGLRVPPRPPPPPPPPPARPVAVPMPGFAAWYSRRSMGPTVMSVLTQASASLAHIAFVFVSRMYFMFVTVGFRKGGR